MYHELEKLHSAKVLEGIKRALPTQCLSVRRIKLKAFNQKEHRSLSCCQVVVGWPDRFNSRPSAVFTSRGRQLVKKSEAVGGGRRNVAAGSQLLCCQREGKGDWRHLAGSIGKNEPFIRLRSQLVPKIKWAGYNILYVRPHSVI